MQTGFSSGTFTFDGVQVKTATEIISENSKTYQTIKDNENLLEECLESFIYTLTEVGALYGIFEMPNDFDVEFNWDDSIIGDKYTDSDFYIKLINSGLVSKKYSLMKILGLTEEQALEMLKEVSDEQAAQQPDLTDILNDTNPLGNQNNDNADMEDET
jgi:A118 family predicted phage portal protein